MLTGLTSGWTHAWKHALMDGQVEDTMPPPHVSVRLRLRGTKMGGKMDIMPEL